MRANNVISDRIKVNDLRGNPIEMAAQVVWRVTDTAQALFDVDDYREFVHIQIESAVRAIGSRYPYDDFTHEEMTLRGNADHVSDELRIELQERVEMAGVHIDECRLTHLAYAQEIEGLPRFRRFGGYGAYAEGWGLYAEQLGKQMGFYQDPYSDFGRLSTELWRAVRLVTDTGLHAKRWSREQAMDYFRQNSLLSERDIEKEVERYKEEKGGIREKAEALDKESQAFDEKSAEQMHLHHRWAQATTALQVSIALAAIALLTKKRWMEWATVALGLLGFSLGGMAALHF